jgi:hypothetical protein
MDMDDVIEGKTCVVCKEEAQTNLGPSRSVPGHAFHLGKDYVSLPILTNDNQDSLVERKGYKNWRFLSMRSD